jgi:ABC-type branched-subunit amino acid transport system permease subunit
MFRRRRCSGIIDFAAAIVLGGVGTVVAVIVGTALFAVQSLGLMWEYVTKDR